MVESEADELTEDQMLGAVLFAHDEFQAVIRAVKELAAEAGKPAWDWKAPAENTVLVNAIKAEPVCLLYTSARSFLLLKHGKRFPACSLRGSPSWH